MADYLIPKEFRIRPARVSDADAVAAVVERAYAQYVERIGRRPAPMDEDYTQALSVPGAWVAELDGRVAGVVVTSGEADQLLIANVAVDPALRGQGVGVRLLRAAEDHARARRLGEVRLYTNEAMTENRRLYLRLGYRETRRGVQDGFRRVHFTKHLPAT